MKWNKLKSSAFIFLIIAAHALIVMGIARYLYSPNNRNPETAQNLQDGIEIAKLARGWMKTELIFNESTGNAYFAKLVADNAGNIHLVWYDSTDYNGAGTDEDIFYRLWNTSIGYWGPIEVVSLEHNGSSFVPSITVDGDGHVHLAWIDNTNYSGSGEDYDIFYKRGNTTTGNWTPTVVLSNVSDDFSMDPALAVDVYGNAHVVWADRSNYNDSGSDNDIFYRYWNATTDTWTITQVLTMESNSSSGLPSVAVDSNRTVHVVWRESTASYEEVFYKYCNATTYAWSSAELISTEFQGDHVVPEIAVDKAGHLHVVWRSDGSYGSSGSDPDIFYKRWNATTGNWTTTEVVSSESDMTSTQPAIATDCNGNVHVAWSDITDLDGGGSYPDIFYKCWNATTGNWTSTEVISTESTSVSANPTITVDGIECVHVAWEDATDYNGAGSDWDIFYKKTVPIPEAPVLASIWPNPDVDGIIELNWSAVGGATIYHIYRATSSIITIDGMSPIGTSFTNNYTDRVPTNGIYYYVVVAGNASGNSSISNCEWVEVAIPFIIPGFALYVGIFAVIALMIMQHRKKSAPKLEF